MSNAIWRSRAIAILGFFILFIIIFPGLPSAWVDYLAAVLGFFVMVLGFIGSRTHAYLSDSKVSETIEVVSISANSSAPAVSPSEQSNLDAQT